MKRVTTNHLLVITIIVNMSCFVSACGSRQKAHFNRGLAYYNRGQLEQSIAEYQKAIQINPNFAQARNNLGNVYYNQSKLEEAVVEYQGAITINPNYVPRPITIWEWSIINKGNWKKPLSNTNRRWPLILRRAREVITLV